jgi:cytochrome c556
MEKHVKHFALGMIAAAAVAFTPLASAESDIEDAIEYRQSMFTGMSWHLGPMADMARGEVDFDREQFELHAKQLYQLSLMPWEGFVEGSYKDGEHGDLTSAIGDIAHQSAIFERMGASLATEAGVLTQVVADEDASERAVIQQFARTAQTCKSCHDDYRQR